MIRVITVRGVKPADRANIAYVGRPSRVGWKGHRLANPFRLAPDATTSERAKCLVEYRAWLLRLPAKELEQALDDLWEETAHGIKPLGCWCSNSEAFDGSPQECHAQILAELLADRFMSVRS